jgi:hypothetical protein
MTDVEIIVKHGPISTTDYFYDRRRWYALRVLTTRTGRAGNGRSVVCRSASGPGRGR